MILGPPTATEGRIYHDLALSAITPYMLTSTLVGQKHSSRGLEFVCGKRQISTDNLVQNNRYTNPGLPNHKEDLLHTRLERSL
jgi:hypothetical protein